MSKVHNLQLICAIKVHLSGDSSIIKKRTNRKAKAKGASCDECNGVFSE